MRILPLRDGARQLQPRQPRCHDDDRQIDYIGPCKICHGWENAEMFANWTYLVLDEKLDTLNGSSGSLGDGGRDTTHCDKLLVAARKAQKRM